MIVTPRRIAFYQRTESIWKLPQTPSQLVGHSWNYGIVTSLNNYIRNDHFKVDLLEGLISGSFAQNETIEQGSHHPIKPPKINTTKKWDMQITFYIIPIRHTTWNNKSLVANIPRGYLFMLLFATYLSLFSTHKHSRSQWILREI